MKRAKAKKYETGNETQNLYETYFPFKNYLKQHPTWNTRASTLPLFLKIAFPIITVLIIFAVKLEFNSFFRGDSPFLLFFAAVTVSAWFGGFRTGFLATIFSLFFVAYFFLHPENHGFKIYDRYIDTRDTIRLSMFFLIGTLISTLSQTMHNTLRNLEINNLKLKRSEELHRLTVDTVKDYAIYTLDADGYITSWNEGGKRIKGYKTEEVLGKHFSVFYRKEDMEQGKPWKVLKTAVKKGRYEEEGPRVKKDGSTFWASVVITPLKDENGKLHGFSQITRDMTTHKELDRRKDEFISIASHELKTPITSIKVFTQIMQKIAAKKKNKKSLHYLGRMEKQIDRLTEIITDLLDVSRIQAGKLEFKKDYFDLNYLVEEIVENLQNTTSKHSIIIKGSIKQKALGDRDRIGQVLINFLTNAIKYSPNSDKIFVKLSTEPNFIVVSVKDFGIGIEKDQLDKIFERFYRVHKENRETFPGLGMGLYIASEIIKRHNGKIWAESEIGKGSTFYFKIPFKKHE